VFLVVKLGDEAYRDSVTTIQLKKETRDFLRTIKVYSVEVGVEGDPGYEGLFVNHIIPLLKKAAGSSSPMQIGKWLRKSSDEAKKGKPAETPA
jgi:hypothetical protein